MDDNEKMNIQQTAHHEAGHSVIAYRLRQELGKTTIIRDGDTLGRASSERAWADGSTDYEQIICLYAGYAAQKQYNPNADPQGSQNDNNEAADLLFVNPALSETQLRDEASKMVAENWDAIQAVACQLLEDKTLDEDELTIIVDAVDEGVGVDKILTEYRYRKSYI
jgi:ATP-dependent Zn protease